ncbi:hypothetical protein CLCR_03218 [Cladophialophora carrionii]|uniref:Uncharacterized protein n=1 Tax=Cladophialophora carrionii TaxID=86049 RepID=A0A1C1D1U4_9EURO|nr:hypothetical protein CLCR_03218 [Cladophialophora carrionii]
MTSTPLFEFRQRDARETQSFYDDTGVHHALLRSDRRTTKTKHRKRTPSLVIGRTTAQMMPRFAQRRGRRAYRLPLPVDGKQLVDA